MTDLLAARDVTYQLGGRRLLDRVGFTAEAGHVLAIVGPNGAGKSTLLRMLSGEVRPTQGEVTISGRAVGTIPQRQLAAKRAVMLQNTRVVFPFTAYEVVRLGAEGIGVGLSRADRDRLALSALAEADADEFADRNFLTLSGGEQQRVNFARALAQLAAGQAVEAPQILFLDEPIASLDIRHQLALLSHVQTLARERNALAMIVLHDLALAHTYADRILVLQKGKLVAVATRDKPLSRDVIEAIFDVSIAGESCAGTPWQPVTKKDIANEGIPFARAAAVV
ncbi:heme ABC transporter ATP-binding protein [Hyphomicrobium sp.]|jgi:iron complex transport system ATP-binding protein|uniref:heme ABC transporter ATP-binding protein n=1 Tax=Hyphomicrobium sp. TaxID=82 RepID=UPI002B98E5E6|nr:heme ABC transporter ATP-binding protein [Hyphomicrobium sp.]HVZ03816.1 heme ABC transporter ATP-binding protein [Hyphomicrobium sp.]